MSTYFGPFTPKGLTFDFAFHHVTSIRIGECDECTNFATRRIYLVDGDGRELVITCFTPNGTYEIPVKVDIPEVDWHHSMTMEEIIELDAPRENPSEALRDAGFYDGFRKLSPLAEADFRKWARKHWSPTIPPNFELWHPVIRDEWHRIDESKPVDYQE